MDKPTLDLLARRVTSDPIFRQQMLADPEVAVREAGLDFTPDDMIALREWHATLRNVTKVDELERALAEFAASRMPTGF